MFEIKEFGSQVEIKDTKTSTVVDPETAIEYVKTLHANVPGQTVIHTSRLAAEVTNAALEILGLDSFEAAKATSKGELVI